MVDTKQLTLQSVEDTNKALENRVKLELIKAGAVQFNMWLPETHTLPQIVHPEEHIVGVVYGRYKKGKGFDMPIVGRGALIATDHRILFLDKKPLFVKFDEVSYDIVSGITYSRVAIAGTVVLRTREGDVSVRTFNQKCARQFVEAIEEAVFSKKV